MNNPWLSMAVLALAVIVLISIIQPTYLSAKPHTSPTVLDSAVTRDIDGNGYLDEIELYFSAPVAFPIGFLLSDVTVFYSNTQTATVLFTVLSIEAMDSSAKKFGLHLAENTSTLPGTQQTAWRPYISIIGISNPVPSTQCKDGAGPVIWNVTKTIHRISDRSQDVVNVTFSEPIQGPNGSHFNTNIQPQIVFYVYRKRVDGSGFDTINTMYGISAFSRLVNDSTLEFTMSNGIDLTTRDYLNINTSSNQIYDSRVHTVGGTGVPPVQNNQKVQVKVINSAANTNFSIVPNPSNPNTDHEAPGEFYARNNTKARDWVRADGAGVVFTFQCVPDTAGINIDIKIFDSFNSMISSASGVIRDSSISSVINVDIYWNGTTSDGKLAHEGAYKAQIKCLLPHQTEPEILSGDFYLTKPDSGHSTCGGNYSIAFLPAIWLKTRRPLLQIIRTFLKKLKSPC
jgi:hypothetical protein